MITAFVLMTRTYDQAFTDHRMASFTMLTADPGGSGEDAWIDYNNLTNYMEEFMLLEEGSTVKSVIKTLLENQKFKALTSFFTDSFESNRSILIFINDQDITVLSGMSSLLQEGDKLTFIPVIHGG